MLRTIGMTTEDEMIFDFRLEEIKSLSLEWYWVDFDRPSEEESELLLSYFDFHPLAIEDCLGRLQRPKMDYYDGYTFFVLHSICSNDLEAEELNMFLGENFIVTFHRGRLQEMDKARELIMKQSKTWDQGHKFVTYQIIDKVVDQYFPILYNIEDHLDEIEEELSPRTVHLSMDYVFEVRSDLLRLRRTIFPMRELLYRMLNSGRLHFSQQEQAYFSDVYDHLIRLGEMIDSNRELTADIRDSQLSINSNRMNSIMTTLTIISSIFIPLTFIVGVYGMNFDRMPELHWQHGYLIVIIVMALIALSMIFWFKKKGWFGIDKT
ncbi:magnesium/cobalt transporter CorA [Sporosarcina thermotolerans]|uniref:Magnesium transport protein CorA n=1 Tax=Sporosarcina thermotolerans TaxID=633404 RepID=A0AAW9A6C0_9BACL|nr:magnesium/cobalt transporter CorA [Sporosarcina thermotolerans]MDW0117061.1 magnesium/cobalt transporter CorA [Sporosarcina thermotolerans]WHT47837.1 magnesium/cobalt transporter CorA [Sporosarcina thermotolerans]